MGTRDGSRLTLTVDGEEAVIDPAKGRLTRRSFRVDVRHGGRSWRLVPDSIPGSRLLRDEQHIGDFTSDGDGRVGAEWREDAEPEPPRHIFGSVGRGRAAVPDQRGAERPEAEHAQHRPEDVHRHPEPARETP
ncbi:hypothetical protein [Streptomyces sp. NPDC003374]